MSYADTSDYETYIGTDYTGDDEELEIALTKATRDVDSVCGAWTVQEGGFKFRIDEDFITDLETWQSDALTRAVCAQAQYRLQQGEEFFIQAQYESVSGKFSVQGRLPYIGPQTVRELTNTGLIKTSARLGRRKQFPSWMSFAYNIDDDDD